MQYRSWLLAGIFAQAGMAQAMGLGEMEVRSHLGAPLQAQLNLFSPGQFEQQEIQVRIARLDIYDRLGARYDSFHNQISFDVRRDANGQVQIVATSRKRVTEPFLDIVVELSWPNGTTYRRYNLLVDPPEYALRWQNKSTKPRTAPLEEASLQLARQAPRPEPRAVETGAMVHAGEAYVVRAGDSLWKIARQLSGNGATSVHATMQALFLANPDAFIGGDRDRLKLGAELRLPADVMAPDTQLARSDAPYKTSAQKSSAAPASSTSPAMAARKEQYVGSDDLAAVQAAITRLQQEKLELQAYRQQLKEEMAQVLQERIAATEALLQAEKLQRQLTQPEPVTTQANVEVETLPVPPTPMASVQTPGSQPEPVAEALSADPPPPARSLSDMRVRDLLAVAETPMATPTDMTMAVAAQDLLGPTPARVNRMIGSSSSSLWYLVAMLPLGILVVLMGMRSHKVQQIRRTEQVKDEDLHDLVFGARRDRSRSESPDQLQQALSQIREKADTHGKQRQQLQATEALEARDDLQQMVELYLLYSQYQKALNVILTEITKRPGRADLRLYLMRVYAEMGDWRSFEEQEEVLRRLGQEQLLEEASQLRALKKAG